MLPTNSKQDLEVVEIPLWNAVFSLALAVAALITSEFLPVSLLTPMARDLGITEGAAGQTISVTAISALISSLLISSITQRFDRRNVLLSFGILQIISNLLVVFAPGFGLLLLGRILLGFGLGGFWAMSAATALRLVPAAQVPKALSIIFGSLSIATVVAAPMGSFLGAHIGWRNVFLIAGGVGVISFTWQLIALPVMQHDLAAKKGSMLNVLKRRDIRSGMLATLFIFIGYSTFFTYLRPFLEKVTEVNEGTLTTILLGFGVANFFGTTLARIVLERNLKRSLTMVSFAMSMIVAGLVFLDNTALIAGILVAAWGLAFGVVQVGWPTWLTRTIPEEAESAGGVQVATIQFAITLGAAFGGIFFDFTGVLGVYSVSSLITFTAGIAAAVALKKYK